MHLYAFVCVLLITARAAVVAGDFLFGLQLISFQNPSNSVADGSCCELEDTCTSPCDIDLRFCLRPANSDYSDTSCPYLELYGDARPRIGNWAVSGAWPGSVQLHIRATHTVGEPDRQLELTDDLLIDHLYIEIENLTSFSPATPAVVYEGEGGRVEAELQFNVACDGDWYGPFCDVECHGRDDSGGHYQCNIYGVRECIEGYQNLETNCTECMAAEGCMNGYCDGPLSCMCLDGWTGDLCTDCIPSQNCSVTGGYCQSPGDCTCRDGFSGDYCDLALTSTMDLQARRSATTPTITPAPPITTNHESPETSSYSVALSIKLVDKAMTVVLLPTVGGVAPGSASTTRWSVSLTMTAVAGAGGLLLLLMLLLCISSLLVAAKRRRMRKYEISTSGRPGLTYDENRLLESTTPTTSEIENEVTASFTTFRNGHTTPQEPLQHELHVYYHRNTPEPPSSRAGERGEEGEEAGGAETVEMEFPSGYTDPWPEEENESHLQWSSLRSDKGEHLLSNGGGESEGGASNGLHAAFNEYQFN